MFLEEDLMLERFVEEDSIYPASDPKAKTSTTRITSLVHSHIDTFISNIFDLYRLAGDTLATKTLSEIAFTEVAICDAVEVAIRQKRNNCMLFSRLDTDVIHSIFGIVLDVDQIHDPNFPLRELNVHRRQIHRMRRVSTAWNKFLLSSPRYWQVLNIKSSPSRMAVDLKRSGSAPLCIYCIRDLGPPVSDQLGLELVWCATRVQTLRSDDPDAYRLCKSLLRTRTSTLKTLQLMGLQTFGHVKPSIDPWRDHLVPSQIRHLTAVGWRPSSGAVWLMGLKELVLHDLSQLDAEILLVLSACVSLERLGIQYAGWIDVLEDVPGIPSTITLPCLQVMNLTFRSNDPGTSLTRKLVTPQLRRASLDVGASDLNHRRADYCQFMSQRVDSNSASIIITIGPTGNAGIVYETESRRFAFEVSSGEGQLQAYHDLVQEFQSLNKGPSLTVRSMESSYTIWPFLETLGDQNVRTIEVHFGGGEADGLLAALAAPSDLAKLVTGTNTNLSFESLKSMVIHDANLDPAWLTVLAEAWQRHRRESKQWEVDLVRCSVGATQLTEAVERLADIGVTLRCFDPEELWF
ncbi:hypothetical protein M407DRAFT_21803 [Tulasnella calospora MUT 4182]|uniref:F-box domain-containing protein n=1 Tax=Tulasnella calospora MUT 4182 TaxID=1051891 RepID=A0A0C3QDI2_9AGAM|nr:hypothetical protein M407DRAFT_21803 [Tulasnella calospora MUT 4182]